jgi:hypothetical protein
MISAAFILVSVAVFQDFSSFLLFVSLGAFGRGLHEAL